MINLPTKIALSLLALLVAFGTGRYLGSKEAPTKQSTEEVQGDKKTQSHETTVITKDPQGNVKTVIVKDTTSTAETTKKKDTTVTAPAPHKSTSVALMAAYDTKHSGAVAYGLSISKEVTGPITAGVWGLNNGTVGLLLGINF